MEQPSYFIIDNNYYIMSNSAGKKNGLYNNRHKAKQLPYFRMGNITIKVDYNDYNGTYFVGTFEDLKYPKYHFYTPDILFAIDGFKWYVNKYLSTMFK